MGHELIATRLGRQIREKRLHRAHTQVSLAAYAQALAALDCEFNVVPARYPTLEEVQGLFD